MNEYIPQSDQWKLDGKCDICRRQGYCKTRCTASETAALRLLRELIRKRISSETDNADEANQ
jgi:hypothetical protein